MGWSYSFWVGNFYPPGTKAAAFLNMYSKHFDTVELDNTFYRVPNAESIRKWREETPDGFIFSAKFPQMITHVKMFRDCAAEVELFIGRMSMLEGKLGPLLIQLPPRFGAKHLEELSDFLASLPKGKRYAVEPRNKSLLGPSLYSILAENKVALTVLDSPIMPTIMKQTSDFAYIRWEGDRKNVSGTKGKIETDRTHDIHEWAEKIRIISDRSVEVFGYFSKYFSGHPPSDVRQLLTSVARVSHIHVSLDGKG
jgi:uncharacterized protein YecE (DUF72 family)